MHLQTEYKTSCQFLPACIRRQGGGGDTGLCDASSAVD